ncbi:MAG: sulfatase family protein [Planctomycetota bacterium]|jgi:N-acetylgalactosamine-6-sulfatase
MKNLALICALLTFTLTTGCATNPRGLGADDDRPNIVLLLADDLGYGDIACYGAPDAKTPRLDRLAQEGVRFTHHYANGPECSPTRTALLTGRYQQRAGGLECAIGTGNVGRYDDAIRLANQAALGLPVEQAVLPRALNEVGYVCGAFGKWHLGYEMRFNPMRYGFAEFFGCLGGNVDYFTHDELSPLPALYQGRDPVEREGYMTHLIADDAVGFIRKHRARPFFLYVPFTSPHFPFQGPGDEGVPFNATNWTAGTRAKYVELIEDLDTQIGRILDELAKQGLSDNTVVVFASDNGAMAPGLNAPFANYKSTAFEGGVRVPMIIRWPGRIAPGQTSSQPCVTFDLTRSFLALAGARPLEGLPLDGMDIIRHVATNQPDTPRTLFWRGKRGERVERAVRQGTMKYYHRHVDGTDIEYLFDLANDPGESNNLIAQQPAIAGALKRELSEWEEDVRAVR